MLDCHAETRLAFAGFSWIDVSPWHARGWADAFDERGAAMVAAVSAGRLAAGSNRPPEQRRQPNRRRGIASAGGFESARADAAASDSCCAFPRAGDDLGLFRTSGRPKDRRENSTA